MLNLWTWEGWNESQCTFAASKWHHVVYRVPFRMESCGVCVPCWEDLQTRFIRKVIKHWINHWEGGLLGGFEGVIWAVDWKSRMEWGQTMGVNFFCPRLSMGGSVWRWLACVFSFSAFQCGTCMGEVQKDVSTINSWFLATALPLCG